MSAKKPKEVEPSLRETIKKYDENALALVHYDSWNWRIIFPLLFQHIMHPWFYENVAHFSSCVSIVKSVFQIIFFAFFVRSVFCDAHNVCTTKCVCCIQRKRTRQLMSRIHCTNTYPCTPNAGAVINSQSLEHTISK